MSLLTDSLKTAADQSKAETADDGAAIGRAALKKQREESTKSLTAALESHRDNGKAKVWHRRITVATNADTESGREIRKVAVFERAGAYPEREFLRLANGAAAAAVKGGWANAEAVESVGAELVCRVLAKTNGRMPKRGQLGQTLGDSENPDAAYLTGMARRLIAEALRGDRGKAGLAAEAFPVAAEEGAADFDLKTAAAESLAAAESASDPYLADPIPPAKGVAGPAAPPRGEFLRPEVKTAVKRLAVETGRRTGAVSAAAVSAIRPNLRAADWADSGTATTAGAHRKNAHTGRAAMADRIGRVSAPSHYRQGAAPSVSVDDWSEADWRLAESVAALAEADAADRDPRPLMEAMEIATYHAPKLDWPMRQVEPDAWRNISADSLAAYPSTSLKV